MSLSKLDKASRIAILNCMGAKKNEKILIITDKIIREIGYSLFNNSVALGFNSLLVEMKPLSTNGEEPSVEVAKLMQEFDIVFCPTSKSLTHTNARREGASKGARIATLPSITKEVMIRGLNADYKKISRLSFKIKNILDNSNYVKITSPSGTNLSFSIQGRKAIASSGLFHKKGEGGNLPTGETFLAPVEGSANGILVIDGSIAGFGIIKNGNLKVKVRNGFAAKIYGGTLATKVNAKLNKFGKNARNIAEFGIGTNHKAKLSGVLLEDEKVLGTIHIAFGNNIIMGGSVNVPIHIDGVVKKPTVLLDDKLIMVDGKLLI